MSSKVRLHQYLSKTGVFDSKQQIWDALRSGKVTVDGEKITNPQYQVKKNSDILFLDGKSKDGPKKLKMISDSGSDHMYLIFNKPAGYLCSQLTEEDIYYRKKSVFSFIERIRTIDEKIKRTLFCVGRLDEDTSGLLIITNDGDLSHKITNPDSLITKKYLVRVSMPISLADKKRIQEGVTIKLENNGKIFHYNTKPCIVKIGPDGLSCEITIAEGKKREVRRIFEAVGNEVLTLQRIAIGGLKLDSLKIREGEFTLVDKEFINDGIFNEK
jgi:pseudouridine synthase